MCVVYDISFVLAHHLLRTWEGERYVCVCVCVCIYIYIYKIHMLCICLYVYVHACVYIYIYIYIYTYICMCVYIYICIYIYIYIYTQTHANITTYYAYSPCSSEFLESSFISQTSVTRRSWRKTSQPGGLHTTLYQHFLANIIYIVSIIITIISYAYLLPFGVHVNLCHIILHYITYSFVGFLYSATFGYSVFFPDSVVGPYYSTLQYIILYHTIV